MLNLEALEDRRLLATFMVSGTSDGPVAAAGDLPGSLRQAIFDANANPGDDSIEFDSTVFTGGSASLIRLTAGELEVIETLVVDGSTASDVTITGDANDDDITDSANITNVAVSFGGTVGAADDLLDDNSRVLNFTSTSGDLTLSSLIVTGGRTTGSRLGFRFDHNGGGIRFDSSGVLLIPGSEINGNSTTGRGSGGGGISLRFGTLVVDNSTISGNSTSGEGASGGGVFMLGASLTVSHSSITGNSTSGNNARGGGVYTEVGDVTFINSLVGDNVTSGDGAHGGGVVKSWIGELRLVNTSVSGNGTMGIDAHGGGIWTNSPVTILQNSTVSGNATAGEGGGISVSDFSSSRKLTIDNSIVAGNTDGSGAPDVSTQADTVFEVKNSLIGIADNLTINSGGNLTGLAAAPLDPLLGPLADNGGPTQTHALLPGSPAIDSASNALAVDKNGWPLVKDQRSFRRVVDGDNDGTVTVDMGAYEFGGTSPLQFPVINSMVRDGNDRFALALARPDLLSTFAVSFDVDVSVNADDLVIRNDTLGGAVIDSSGFVLKYDSTTHTATWDFSSLALDTAFYSFELSDDIVSVDGSLSLDGDFDGNPGGTFIESIYVAIPGDANLDGRVDVLGDGFDLLGNLGTTNGATWAQGDFNGDGAVDVFSDGFLLLSQIGQSVIPPATSLSTASVTVTASTSTLASQRTSTERDPVTLAPQHRQLTAQEDDGQARRLPTLRTLPSLAGSQSLDAAFEIANLLDDGLF